MARNAEKSVMPRGALQRRRLKVRVEKIEGHVHRAGHHGPRKAVGFLVKGAVAFMFEPIAEPEQPRGATPL
jgi:hypothetical protein